MAPLSFSYFAIILSFLSVFIDLSLAAPADVFPTAVPTCTKRKRYYPASTVATTPAATTTVAAITVNGPSGGSRMDIIKNMYAFGGFVYTIGTCPSQSKMTADFQQMKAHGARTVITFEYCKDGMSADYYGEVINAAGAAGIYVMPLAWTLPNAGQTYQSNSVPRMQAVTDAVIKNPGPVLAVAYGDEPLYDHDADSPNAFAQTIRGMKAQFTKAELDIPVSISEMAYGWQLGANSGSIDQLVDTLDFFMINDFPYFAPNAGFGGASGAWDYFTKDVDYFTKIAKGKPLMVTMTGWPSNKNQYSPNSARIQATVASQEGYWKLLDGHCSDYFKSKHISWLWRSWSDAISGWGVVDLNGKEKFDFKASTTC